MYKKSIALLFSLLFVAMLSLPSIIIAVDNSIDISFFYDFAEQEEEKGSEKNKIDIELLFTDLNDSETELASTNAENDLEYYFKKYSKPHLNLISPPPDLNIL